MVGTSVMPSSFAAATRPWPAMIEVAVVDEDRIVEAERLDAVGDLADLPARVRARVARVEFQLRDGTDDDLEVAGRPEAARVIGQILPPFQKRRSLIDEVSTRRHLSHRHRISRWSRISVLGVDFFASLIAPPVTGGRAG